MAFLNRALFEQSKQRGLIDYPAGEKRFAVVFQGDGQALKPICPLTIQPIALV
jgi:hypothetical protein